MSRFEATIFAVGRETIGRSPLIKQFLKPALKYSDRVTITAEFRQNNPLTAF